MADNILYLNISLVSSKCLFEVWLFDKGGMDDKIAMIAMRRRIFRKNVPTSNAQQSCIASLNLCSRFVAHIPIRVLKNVLYSRNYEVRRGLNFSSLFPGPLSFMACTCRMIVFVVLLELQQVKLGKLHK